MADQDGEWQSDMLLALVQAHWNLVGSIANEAHREGIPPHRIEQALQRLLDRNAGLISERYCRILNQGIEGVRDLYRS